MVLRENHATLVNFSRHLWFVLKNRQLHFCSFVFSTLWKTFVCHFRMGNSTFRYSGERIDLSEGKVNDFADKLFRFNENPIVGFFVNFTWALKSWTTEKCKMVVTLVLKMDLSQFWPTKSPKPLRQDIRS